MDFFTVPLTFFDFFLTYPPACAKIKPNKVIVLFCVALKGFLLQIYGKPVERRRRKALETTVF